LAALLSALLLVAVMAASPLAAPTEAAPLLGVQAHLLWTGVARADVRAQLNRAQNAGATLVRVDLGWSNLQRNGRRAYDKRYLRRIATVLAEAHRRRIGVLFTVTTTPCWASSAPASLKQGCSGSWWFRGVQNYAPTRAAYYADALGYLVKRFRVGVAGWEIWNEPNSSDFFVSPDSAGAYARLVKAAYRAAKAANPSATIIAGSLMHADYAFARALYAHGIKGHFDAFSIHPYSENRSPLDPGSDQWINVSFLRGVPAVHSVMTSQGDAKPLWLTEFGWSTATVRAPEGWRNGVDEATQALYLQQAFEQMRRWPYLQAGVWFKLADAGQDRSDLVDNFGLLRADGTPKLAYEAFRSEARGMLSGRVAARSLTSR
jgi:hypothetical protein